MTFSGYIFKSIIGGHELKILIQNYEIHSLLCFAIFEIYDWKNVLKELQNRFLKKKNCEFFF